MTVRTMQGLMSAALILLALGFGAQIATMRSARISEPNPIPAVPDHDGAAAPVGWPVPYVRLDELGRPFCRRDVLEIGCPRP